MQTRIDVTFIILTKDEEVNIAECLKSISGFAKRIVVIDSGSVDKTKEIAESLGAEVYVHPFETHARQFNWGLDHLNIKTKWVFHLDADERLTPALKRELAVIANVHDNDDVNGVVMEAWLYFMGRKIKHGAHNKRKLMMFKTGIGRMEDRRVDEHAVLSSGRTVLCRERFIHYDFKNISHWINKMNWYATKEMHDYFDYVCGREESLSGKKKGKHDGVINATRAKKFGLYYRLPKFLRCWMLFFYCYVFLLGFLDGKEGFIFNFMYHCWYRSLVDAKIVEKTCYNKPADNRKGIV